MKDKVPVQQDLPMRQVPRYLRSMSKAMRERGLRGIAGCREVLKTIESSKCWYCGDVRATTPNGTCDACHEEQMLIMQEAYEQEQG